MKKLLIVLLACSGCYSSMGAYPVSPNFYRDNVFCWYKGDTNRWHVQGLADSCPGGAEYRP